MRRCFVWFLLFVAASAGCTSQGELADTSVASPSTSPTAVVESTVLDEARAVPKSTVATEEPSLPFGTAGCAADTAEGLGQPGTLYQSPTGSTPEPPAGISNIDLRVTLSCTTITIAFADQNGPISTVPNGIEVVSSQGQTRLRLPDSVALGTTPLAGPVARAFWEHGAAVPVSDGDRGYVLIAHGSFDAPIITAQSGPARVTVEFPTGVNSAVVTLDDAFIIDEIGQSEPGKVNVSGWGAAFEGHAGIGLIDSNGRKLPAGDGWSIVDHTSGTTEFFSIRMGNPGVAWAPFSFTIVTDLPAGDYGMYLDSCGGQCDPVPHETVSFTLSTT